MDEHSVNLTQQRIEFNPIIICPFCKAINGFVEDTKSGDIVCTECGLVLSERIIDLGSEWRNFSESDKDRSRAFQVDEFIGELSTDISRTTFGSNKHGGELGKMPRVQNRMALGPQSRNLVSAFEKIAHLSEVLNFPQNIKNRAKSLYKQFEEKRTRTMRGNKKEAVIAAILYMACKEEQVPRTFKELSKETGIKEKEIRKFYRSLTQLLPKTEGLSTAVSPVDLVNRFCSKLNLSHEIVTAASSVAEKVIPLLEGKSPSSIAAASILLVTKLSDQKRLEKDIADAASISATTIRNVFKEMQSFPDILPYSVFSTKKVTNSDTQVISPS